MANSYLIDTTPCSTPSNPLVNQHPIDTLVHIRAVLAFLQEYVSKTTEDPDLLDAQINTGHYAVLQLVNDALEYEITRLDQDDIIGATN